MQGDNERLSVDSRSFGAIPCGLLEGLVLSVAGSLNAETAGGGNTPQNAGEKEGIPFKMPKMSEIF